MSLACNKENKFVILTNDIHFKKLYFYVVFNAKISLNTITLNLLAHH